MRKTLEGEEPPFGGCSSPSKPPPTPRTFRSRVCFRVRWSEGSTRRYAVRFTREEANPAEERFGYFGEVRAVTQIGYRTCFVG